MSTLDLFGRGFVLLTGPGGADWREAADRRSRSHPGVELEVHGVGGPDLPLVEGSFNDAYDVSETGAVLVRPDGFVAWRARADSPEERAGAGRGRCPPRCR